jgi:beta-lactamase regulating signal transducer with metallopeptidase domain
MSLSGTVMILILFSIRSLVKQAFSKSWQYYVWLLVLVRLLVPISPDFGLFNIMFEQNQNTIQNAEAITQSENFYDPYMDYAIPSEVDNMYGTDKVSVNRTADNATENTAAKNDDVNLPNTFEGDNLNTSIEPVDASVNRSSKLVSGLTIAGMVWIIGVVLLFLRKGKQYRTFIKAIHHSSEPVVDQRSISIYRQMAKKLHIRRVPRLFVSYSVQAPMLIGLLRPTIYVTEKTIRMEQESLSFVLQHELTHYKRHDILYKWFCEFVLIIHWFNPFIHLMCKHVNELCEISCDEAIARDLGKAEKLIYGNVLLQAAEDHLVYRRSVLSTTLYEDKKSLKERLAAICQANHKSYKVKLVAVLTTMVLCIAAICLGTYSASQTNRSSNEDENSKQTSKITKLIMKDIASGFISDIVDNTNDLPSEVISNVIDNTEDLPSGVISDVVDNTEDMASEVVSDIMDETWYGEDVLDHINYSEDNYSEINLSGLDQDNSLKNDFMDKVLNIHKSTKGKSIIKNVKPEKASVDIDCGNISIGYNSGNTVQINVRYEARSNTREVADDILAESKLQANVIDGCLDVRVVKKGTDQNIWDYLEEKYGNGNYSLSANLDILLPSSVNEFDTNTCVGNIYLKSLSGRINAMTEVGNLLVEDATFKGDCKLRSEIGTINCKLGKEDIADSKVALSCEVGDIYINSNGNKYTIENSSIDDYVTSSKEILVDKICRLVAETSVGNIRISD